MALESMLSCPVQTIMGRLMPHPLVVGSGFKLGLDSPPVILGSGICGILLTGICQARLTWVMRAASVPPALPCILAFHPATPPLRSIFSNILLTICHCAQEPGITSEAPKTKSEPLTWEFKTFQNLTPVSQNHLAASCWSPGALLSLKPPPPHPQGTRQLSPPLWG